jgi:exosortase/archaeosortase family protein
VIVCTAMATLAAFVSTAPIPQRVVVLLSGIPLALVTNIMRIVTMGMISEAYGQETAERLFHDVSGLAMILVALVGLAAEMRLLDWIYDIPLDDEHHKPMFAQPAA